MIQTPMFCIPKFSKKTKRAFIIIPKNLAIGPIIKASLCAKYNDNSCNLPHYGTGSNPPLEKGLHLKILHSASNPPFKAPYFSTASNPYVEHVGI